MREWLDEFRKAASQDRQFKKVLEHIGPAFFGDVRAEEVIAALKKLQEEKALLKVENARLLDRLKEAEGGE